MFSNLLPVIGLFAALLVAATILPKLKAISSKASGFTFYPYASRTTLFSAAERSFLGVLEQCLDTQYQVHGKVRLADILKVKASNASERQSAFNRISRKHVDFVITRTSDAKIIGVIELDDKSHNKPDRQERDAFVDNALGAAAVPIFHVKAKASYSLPEVKKALASFSGIA